MRSCTRPSTNRSRRGARWAYVFGSVLFSSFPRRVTGVFLSLYYVPSADHAHTTVAYIVKEVTGGSFLRSLHAYGSSAVIIVTAPSFDTNLSLRCMHKGRREVLWISGCASSGLMLAMAFTGYLLPCGPKAYFATTVGTNMASEVPWIGSALKRLHARRKRNGNADLIPLFRRACLPLTGQQSWAPSRRMFISFRKAGAADRQSEDPVNPKLPTRAILSATGG